MTQGVFEVSGIYPAALSKEEVVEYAACAESYSSHPISKSLQKAYGKAVSYTHLDVYTRQHAAETVRI